MGLKILIAEADLPNLPAGEFYWHQLIGLEVVNESRSLGVVESMMETGANDVLVCKNKENPKTDILIPYTPETVLVVDLESKQMTVDWDPSFLE